jgi:hypothetical protein
MMSVSGSGGLQVDGWWWVTSSLVGVDDIG